MSYVMSVGFALLFGLSFLYNWFRQSSRTDGDDLVDFVVFVTGGSMLVQHSVLQVYVYFCFKQNL